MRWSQAFIPTLKESPSEAEVASHFLMLKGGMIQKLASGIYSMLPLGLRSLQKLAKQPAAAKETKPSLQMAGG